MPTNIGKTVSKTGYVRNKNEVSVRILKTARLETELAWISWDPVPSIKPWNLLFKVIVHFWPWDSPPSNPAHLGKYVWFTLCKHLNMMKQVQGNWPGFLGAKIWGRFLHFERCEVGLHSLKRNQQVCLPLKINVWKMKELFGCNFGLLCSGVS